VRLRRLLPSPGSSPGQAGNWRRDHAYIDGALLVDLWDDLVLPRAVRSAWAPLISAPGKAEA